MSRSTSSTSSSSPRRSSGVLSVGLGGSFSSAAFSSISPIASRQAASSDRLACASLSVATAASSSAPSSSDVLSVGLAGRSSVCSSLFISAASASSLRMRFWSSLSDSVLSATSLSVWSSSALTRTMSFICSSMWDWRDSASANSLESPSRVWRSAASRPFADSISTATASRSPWKSSSLANKPDILSLSRDIRIRATAALSAAVL